MDNLWQDLRYGARMLLKKPGFTLIAVVTLALGIGANTAIFSVVNSVLLRTLPYKEPDRLVMVWVKNVRLQSEYPATAADFVDWRERSQVFDHVAAIQSQPFNLTGGSEAERVGGVRASASLFPLLGVEPAQGRTFAPEEDQPGNNRVVVISHGLWSRRFGSDPGLMGKTITLNDQAYTVIGVMPEGFQFPRRGEMPEGFQFAKQPELWTPLALSPDQMTDRGRQYLAVIARLKPSVTIEQAQSAMSSLAKEIEEQSPNTNTDLDVRLASLHTQMVGKIKPALLILLGAVGFVLLIVCANVANLLLASAAARRKETAIRIALGASRGRLIRQLLTESMLLSLTGGVFGLLLAVWGKNLLLALAPEGTPRMREAGLDATVLCFTTAISLVTGVIFGLVPALQASKPELNETLKEGGGKGYGSSRQNRIRNSLVVSEVALSIVLLIGSGLLLKSFVNLVSVNPGFDPENVLTASVGLPLSRYPERQSQVAFFQQLLDSTRSLPGVESASAVYPLPLSGAEEGMSFSIEGRPAPPPGEVRSAGPRWVMPDYFRTMRIPLLKGRHMTEQDAGESQQVIVINRAMAQRYWPDEDPVGKRLTLSFRGDGPREIIGIVDDVKHTALDAEANPEMYIPYLQFPGPLLTLVVRTSSDPHGLVSMLRNEVSRIDKDQPVYDVRSMEQLVYESASPRKFNALLLAIFAAVALTLAAIGIYGVMSYSVTQRSREIGLRMALGARVPDVLKMVIGQGMRLAVAGVAIGLAGSLALTRVLSGLLYGVSPSDPVTFVVITTLSVVVTLLASYIPARRAAKLDPMVALRHE